MYIDFKILKQKLDVFSIIKYYNLSGLTKHKDSYSGPCPIHKGDNPSAFHFNIQKKIFNCFTHCGGGNILDFIAKMEAVSIHKAALSALNIIGNTGFADSDLGFRLVLNSNHEYLKSRNLSSDTIQHFDIGFCNSGMLKGRLAIPIHSSNGSLAAYAGRTIDDSTPKYIFPSKFKKSFHLFNYHRIVDRFNTNLPIFIVEGFFDVFALHQMDCQALALMGCSVSPQQLQLLKSLNASYILMLDGDSPGATASENISEAFRNFGINFKTVSLSRNLQPENCELSFIKSLF